MTIVGNSKSLARLGEFLNQKIHRGVFNRQNLLLTNCLISTLMGTVGDCVQQNYDILSSKLADDKDGERPKFNYVRSAHMSAAGLTTGRLNQLNKRCSDSIGLHRQLLANLHGPTSLARNFLIRCRRLSSNHLESPRITSNHLESPRIFSNLLESPLITSNHLESPRISSNLLEISTNF